MKGDMVAQTQIAGTSGSDDLFSSTSACAESTPDGKAEKGSTSRKEKAPSTLTAEVRAAYVYAYTARYGVAPVLAAKQMGQLGKLVQMLGKDAPEVARYFVASDRPFYKQRLHDVGLLLADATGLRTQWATGIRVTDTVAGSAVARQGKHIGFDKLDYHEGIDEDGRIAPEAAQ